MRPSSEAVLMGLSRRYGLSSGLHFLFGPTYTVACMRHLKSSGQNLGKADHESIPMC